MSVVLGPMCARLVLGLVVVAAIAIGGCAAASQTATPATVAAATWRLETVLPFDAGQFEAAARERGVVAGDLTAWARLDDGWMPVDTSDGSPHYGLVAAPHGLVAWQEGGHVQTSDLGLDWVDAATDPDEANVGAIVPFGGHLVMLGDAIRKRVGAWSSTDGTAWSPLEHAPLGMAAGTEVGGGGLVAVGSTRTNPAAWLTEDGTEWRAIPPAPAEGSMIGVAEAAGTVVAIGDVGGTAVAWRSHDLATWASSALLSTSDMSLRTIAHVRGMFLLAGQRNQQPTLWLSPDGGTWTTAALPVPPASDGTAVVIREVGDQVLVFGYVMEDAGNGGSWPVAHLVWSLTP